MNQLRFGAIRNIYEPNHAFRNSPVIPPNIKVYDLVEPSDIYHIRGFKGYFIIDPNKSRVAQIRDYIYAHLPPTGSLKSFVQQWGRIGLTNSSKIEPQAVCQLTGMIYPLSKLKWERIYNRKLLVSTKARDKFVYVHGLQCYVKPAFAQENNYNPIFGRGISYTVNHTYVQLSTGNYIGDISYSDYERELIDRSQSNVVYLRPNDNTPVYVSLFEINTQRLNRYGNCTECGHHINLNTFETHICPRCVASGYVSSRRPSSEAKIYNYSHRVEKTLGFDDTGCRILRIPEKREKTPLYLGIELEYNVKDDYITPSVKHVHETGYALCKSDSSIRASGLGDGYEIVSQPCSIEKHKKYLSSILSKCGKWYVAGPTCGLHVHISRSPFTDSDIGKMLAFIHREANREFISGLARRESHRYARFTDSFIKENKTNPRALSTPTKHKLLTNQDHSSINRERYTALNVGDKTLEFRIFASTTDITEILASIQFCEALALYALAHSTSSKYSQLPLTKWMDVSNFLEFLKESKIKTQVSQTVPNTPPQYDIQPCYPELETFIITNKLPTSSKNQNDILLTKVLKYITSNVSATPRHREIPTSIANDIAQNLLANRPLMLRWLHANSDGKKGFARYNKEISAWELFDSSGEVMFSHSKKSMKVA